VPLLGPGLVLSSDVPAHGWFHLRDFLKENGVKITFYVSGYKVLKSPQIDQMRAMQQDGHEIAHHTATHPHINEYLKSHSMDDYMRDEIFVMKDLMAHEGFNTKTFAYPHGDNTTESDQKLLEHFNSVRKTLNPYLSKHIEDMDPIYYRYGNIEIMNGCSIDRKSGHSRQEIIDALIKAKESRQTLCLYCHWIGGYGVEEDFPYSIAEDDLKAILLKAKELGLTFYTANDVSKKKY
jgi:peptidoglycan/xylan/chitin deacetylase (PgdA/CDA1 family)